MATMPVILRYPGEGEAAFSAFCHYLGTGWSKVEDGSFARRARPGLGPLGETHGMANLILWVRQFDWYERTSEYDLQVLAANEHATKQLAQATELQVAQAATALSANLLVEIQKSIEDSRAKGKIIPIATLAGMLEKLAKVQVLTKPVEANSGNASPNLAGISDADLIDMVAGDSK